MRHSKAKVLSPCDCMSALSSKMCPVSPITCILPARFRASVYLPAQFDCRLAAREALMMKITRCQDFPLVVTFYFGHASAWKFAEDQGTTPSLAWNHPRPFARPFQAEAYAKSNAISDCPATEWAVCCLQPVFLKRTLSYAQRPSLARPKAAERCSSCPHPRSRPMVICQELIGLPCA